MVVVDTELRGVRQGFGRMLRYFKGAERRVFLEVFDGTMDDERIILHLDLDCFYAQVEHRRLAIPVTEPLAVVQVSSAFAHAPLDAFSPSFTRLTPKSCSGAGSSP